MDLLRGRGGRDVSDTEMGAVALIPSLSFIWAVNSPLTGCFFQALAQNSELRERLSKIHTESQIAEAAAVNVSSHMQVGDSPPLPPPPSH